MIAYERQAADSARKSRAAKIDTRLSRKLTRARSSISVADRKSLFSDASPRRTKIDASIASGRQTYAETSRRTKVDANVTSGRLLQRRAATLESMEAGVLRSRKLWQTMDSSLREMHTSAPQAGKSNGLEVRMLRGLWSEAREQYAKRKLDDQEEYMDGKQLLGTAISTVFASVHKALKKKDAVHVFQQAAMSPKAKHHIEEGAEEGGDSSEEDDSDEEDGELTGQMDEIETVQHELENLVETKGWGEQMIDSFTEAAVSLNAMTMRLACLKRKAQKAIMHRHSLQLSMEETKSKAEEALARFWRPPEEAAQPEESQEPDAPISKEPDAPISTEGPMPTFEPMPTAEMHERLSWQPKARKTQKHHDSSQLQKGAALSAVRTSVQPVQPKPKAKNLGKRVKLLVALSKKGVIKEQSIESIKQKLLAAADINTWVFLFRKHNNRKVDSLLVPDQFQAVIREGSQLPHRLLSHKDLQKLFHHINTQKTKFISYRHDFLPWLLCEDGDSDTFAMLQEINNYLDSAPQIGNKGQLDQSEAHDSKPQASVDDDCNDAFASHSELNEHLGSAHQEDAEGPSTANDCRPRSLHEDSNEAATASQGEIKKGLECVKSSDQRPASSGYPRRELYLSTANDCRPTSAPAILGMSSSHGKLPQPRPAMPLALVRLIAKCGKKIQRRRSSLRPSLRPSLRSSTSEQPLRTSLRSSTSDKLRKTKSVRFSADAVEPRSSLPGHGTATPLGDFRMVPTSWWTNLYAKYPCSAQAPSLAEQPKAEVGTRAGRSIIDPNVDVVEYPVEAEVLEYEQSDSSSSDDGMEAEENDQTEEETTENEDEEDEEGKEETADIEFGGDAAVEEYMLRGLDDLNESEEDDNMGDDVNEIESAEELQKRITVCTNHIHEFVDKFHNLFKEATRNSTEVGTEGSSRRSKGKTSILKVTVCWIIVSISLTERYEEYHSHEQNTYTLQDEPLLLNVQQAICDVAFSFVSSPPQRKESKRRSITQRLSLSRVALAGWEVLKKKNSIVQKETDEQETEEAEEEEEEEVDEKQEEKDWYTVGKEQQQLRKHPLHLAASLDDEAATKAVSSILSSFVLAPQEVPSAYWTAKVGGQQHGTKKSAEPPRVPQESNLPSAAMPLKVSASSRSPQTDSQAVGLIETVVKQRTKRFSRVDPKSMRGNPCNSATREAEPPQLFVPVAPATPPLREARPFKHKHRWQRLGGTLDEDPRPIIDVLPSDFSLPPSPTPLPPIDGTDGNLPFRRRRHRMVTVPDDPPFSKTRRQNLSIRLPRGHDHV